MFMLYISYDLNLADTVSSEHLSFKDAEGISKKLSVSYSYYYDLFEFLSAPKIFVSLREQIIYIFCNSTTQGVPFVKVGTEMKHN